MAILQISFIREAGVVVLGGHGSEDATLGEKEVGDDLQVEAPLSGGGIYEDGRNLDTSLATGDVHGCG